VRPAVGTVLGARGRWLAGHRAQWQRAVYQARAAGIAAGDGNDTGDGAGTSTGTSAAGTTAAGTGREPAAPAADGAADTAQAELTAWRTGDRDARRALLAEARRRDPAAGRELLRSGWKGETAFDRTALLYLLRDGLSADLYEGGDTESTLARLGALRASGVCVVALLALSDDGAPSFDAQNAAELAGLGIPAFACTPDAFPDLLAVAVEGGDVGAWPSAANRPPPLVAAVDGSDHRRCRSPGAPARCCYPNRARRLP
jgi:hypothetical protein